jgi:hypothetical protein
MKAALTLSTPSSDTRRCPELLPVQRHPAVFELLIPSTNAVVGWGISSKLMSEGPLYRNYRIALCKLQDTKRFMLESSHNVHWRFHAATDVCHVMNGAHIEHLCSPYTINHVAQNCFAKHKFAHSRSSQSAPYTVNHVAQHAMLRNMIDRVWAPL